jgi:hypothetical protein
MITSRGTWKLGGWQGKLFAGQGGTLQRWRVVPLSPARRLNEARRHRVRYTSNQFGK